MPEFYNNAVFWVEVGKVKPNPYQPRREFDEVALQSLADSIRQYGVLQPLVVTRIEIEKDDGGLTTEYELISGERRLRASKIAGLSQVPALIRDQEHSDKVKLELAIIENLQREDLNPIERAGAFQKLVEDFNFKHAEVAKKIGKSREYVSNSLRLLSLPEHMKDAVVSGKITEGHARPLLMLSDRPAEQDVLFKEITIKKLTVRDSEQIARRIAHDKVRKKVHDDPRLMDLEKELSEILGTRVRIEQKAKGGKLTIDFFDESDLQTLLSNIYANPSSVSGSAQEDSQEGTGNTNNSTSSGETQHTKDLESDDRQSISDSQLSSGYYPSDSKEESAPYMKDRVQSKDSDEIHQMREKYEHVASQEGNSLNSNDIETLREEGDDINNLGNEGDETEDVSSAPQEESHEDEEDDIYQIGKDFTI